jgi:uncharacterized protein YjiS (DUF1127 family)
MRTVLTTIESIELPAALPEKPGIFAALWQALLRYRGRRAREVALINLADYDSHLLRDMGIDPRDVSDALRSRHFSLLFDPLRRSDL